MPGPPPPPPPGGPPPMMPPPPTAFVSSGGPDDRLALLLSIRKGANLKKTTTVDKSAPMIGKVTSNSPSGNSTVGGSQSFRGGSSTTVVPNGLGGLFAGGIPKLKATGKNLGASSNSVNNSTRTPESPSPKSFNSIQNELKKQMANDSRNRGPPPPAPIRNYNQSEDSSSRHQFLTKNGNSNGFHQNPSLPNLASPQTLGSHRKTSSNVSLSVVDSSSEQYTNNSPRPTINHGKPNLAPKPPVLNGKPAAPPKRLLMNGKPVGRAQSMRSPRSPSPQSPENNNPDFNTKFGTVRNLSQVLNQSLGHSLGNLSHVKPRPLLNGRPTAPPPSIPNTPPPPPPNKMVKPPNHAPPPPPNVIPQAPNHAPPPPPHRTGVQAPARPPPLIPTFSAPPPPPRHSSMRDVNSGGNSRRSSSSSAISNLEARFNFHAVSEFPRPMPFRAMPKVYNTRQVGNKQQAPPPPNQIQLTNRLWESSTC